MPEAKTKCSKCGTEVLVATSERTGGSCMPCHQRAQPISYDLTPDNERRVLAIDAIIRLVLGGCSEDEFGTLRCPVCGGSLRLNVHPNLRAFCVSCTVSSLHLCRSEEIQQAPAWWHSRVS